MAQDMDRITANPLDLLCRMVDEVLGRTRKRGFSCPCRHSWIKCLPNKKTPATLITKRKLIRR